MSRPARLLLPRDFYGAMLEHAKSELPNECCGLFAGDREDKILRVRAWYPLVNEAASPTEYLSEPRSMFAAIKAMRKSNYEVVAAYHSHPTSEPIPSRKDLALNYSDDVVNLIIGLSGATPLVRGWWLTEGDFTEAGWELVDA